jgi:hypothetical protein
MTPDLLQGAQSNPASLIEYSAHSPGRHLIRELSLTFSRYQEAITTLQLKQQMKDQLSRTAPEVLASAPPMRTLKDMIVVPTFQKSLTDLVAVTPDTNWERNLLLEYVS